MRVFSLENHEVFPVKDEGCLDEATFNKSSTNVVNLRGVLFLITYMKKFLHSDLLRAVQFFLNSAEKSLFQKEVTNQAF